MASRGGHPHGGNKASPMHQDNTSQRVMIDEGLLSTWSVCKWGLLTQRIIMTIIAVAIDWALTIYQALHLALYLCLSHLIFATTPWGRYNDHPSYTDRELRIEEVEWVAWVYAEGGSGSRFVQVQSPWPGPWIGLAPSKIVKLMVFLKCGFRAVHLFTSLRLSSHLSLRDSTPPCPSSHTFLPSITLPPSHIQIQTHLSIYASWCSFKELETLINKSVLRLLLVDSSFLIRSQWLFELLFSCMQCVVFLYLISRFSFWFLAIWLWRA